MKGASASDISIQVKQDFASLWSSYDHNRLEFPAAQIELIKSAHKFAICTSLLAKAITSESEHRRIFLQELSSDNLHLIHVLMGGDSRGACFYLRSIIENFWRHHYFCTHPVEYGWLQTRKKYHLTMKELREYCGWLDRFQGRLKPCLDRLDRRYGELSTQVHSSSSKTLVLRDALDQIKLTKPQGNNFAKDMREVLKDVVVLTIFHSREVFDGLHVNSQAFILACLDSQRKRWRQEDLGAIA
jgi:hypothetical protein